MQNNVASGKAPLKKRARAKMRRPRVSHIGDLIGATMGDLLRKRGFASSDLVANWHDIAPAPYDTQVVPDRLKWPRRAAHDGREGGVLHVRVAPAQALALQHDAPLLMARINGYFGYELVSEIRAMQIPLQRDKTTSGDTARAPSPQDLRAARTKVADTLDGVSEGPLKESLRRLGTSIVAAPKK